MPIARSLIVNNSFLFLSWLRQLQELTVTINFVGSKTNKQTKSKYITLNWPDLLSDEVSHNFRFCLHLRLDPFSASPVSRLKISSGPPTAIPMSLMASAFETWQVQTPSFHPFFSFIQSTNIY